MTSIQWKSAEVLKVFGTTIRKGTFTGGKATPTGIIEKDEPTNFTPNYIAQIYENITTHVPFYIGHAVTGNDPVGYAYKFGVTDSLDDMKYQGFVFNKDSQNKIINEGYDCVSPEISEINGVPYLKGIAFVKNPAISGTEVGMEATVFSKPTTNDSNGENTVSDTAPTDTVDTISTQEPITTSTPTTPNIVVNVPPVPTTDVSAMDIASIKAQMEEYKLKFEQQAAKTEQILTGQYRVLASELKNLGIDDPSSIVKDLPTEQKITVLSKLKDGIIKNKPLAQPTASTGQDISAETENNKALKEVMAEMGITEEQYKKISGGKTI